MATGGEIADRESQSMDSLDSHPEHPSTLTKDGLTADEVVPDVGNDNQKPHGAHNRKSSNASDHGTGSHGFLPGLMKKIGFGSQDLKGKKIHESDGSIKKASAGSQDLKNVGDGEQPHHRHHRHGTRDRDIFGSEDAAEGNDRERQDIFGSRDMETPQNAERANSLFGFEDTKFESGEKGREIFGRDDPDSLSFQEKNIVGPVDASSAENERARHIFGDENAEDNDDEGGPEDDLKRKKGHGKHSVSD